MVGQDEVGTVVIIRKLALMDGLLLVEALVLLVHPPRLEICRTLADQQERDADELRAE